MLRRLTIRDFVLVDRLELEFHAGFGALTGETGAGKSILVDALAFALGERADSGTIRLFSFPSMVKPPHKFPQQKKMPSVTVEKRPARLEK